MSRPITRHIPFVVSLCLVVLVAGVPAAAQDAPPEGSPGLLAEILPMEVSGMPLEPMEYPVPILLSMAGADDEERAAATEALEAFSSEIGVPLDELYLGSASAIDSENMSGVFIVGLRTSDPAVAPGVEAFVDLMLAMDENFFAFDEVTVEPTLIDDREVYIIAPEILQDGEYADGDRIGLDAGGYTLLMDGTEEAIREILAALP
jgi:hypothetical protein